MSIEGNIGSGKSSVIRHLKEHPRSFDDFRILIAEEPVNCWETVCTTNGENILQCFYRDPVKYSFPFQVMALTSRIQHIKRLLQQVEEQDECDDEDEEEQDDEDEEKEKKPVVILTERSLYADYHVFASMLANDGLLDDVSFQIYKNMFEEFASKYVPTCIMYMDSSVELCHARIKTRARIGEENIEPSYLKKVDTFHQRFLKAMSQTVATPTLVTKTKTLTKPAIITAPQTTSVVRIDVDGTTTVEESANSVCDILKTIMYCEECRNTIPAFDTDDSHHSYASYFYDACQTGNLPLVKKLMKIRPHNAKVLMHPFSCRCFIVACKLGHLELAKYLYNADIDVTISTCNDDGETAFSVACANGHIHVVEWLLQLHTQQTQKEEPWPMDVNEGFIKSCERGQMKIAEMLHDKNPQIDFIRGFQIACLYRQQRIAHWLVKLHPELNDEERDDEQSESEAEHDDESEESEADEESESEADER